MIEPRSNEWFALRRGKFSASVVYKLMGKRGGISTATAQTYIHEKVAEALTGWHDDLETYAMRWGIELEPDAREYYELAFGCDVEMVDPIPYGDHVICSPDGIIKGQDKGVEIKCPFNPANHVQYMTIRSDEDLKVVAEKYYWQVQMCMMITGFQTWDFISYDPRFTGKYRMFAVEIKRNNDDIERLKTTLLQAVEMKLNLIKRIEL